MNIAENIGIYRQQLPQQVTLVAISKTKSSEDILEAYRAGQRVFGENKVQELTEKHEQLPKDIQWHMVGHLQRNKVKNLADFVGLIHAVDSLKLLKEINKQAKKHERVIECLLQIKIAREDTKYGLTAAEAEEILSSPTYRQMSNVKITGLMGMATFTQDQEQVKGEFQYLKKVFDEFRQKFPELKELSMGMSGDYQLAIDSGSTMVRIGSSIFGARN